MITTADLGNFLIGFRSLCFMVSILTCINFSSTFIGFWLDLLRGKCPSSAAHGGHAIFTLSAGIMFLTVYRTVSLFSHPPSAGCSTELGLILCIDIGYVLFALALFQLSLGRAINMGNRYLGIAPCILAATASFLLTLYAMHIHLCG